MEDEEGEGQGWEKGLFYKKRWTPDRIRRILQECSSRYLGVRLTISVWKDIAIAISRRYLQGEFKEEGVAKMETRETKTRKTRKTTSGICRRATGRMWRG